MQQHEDPPTKGAYYGGVGGHPAGFQTVPPVMLGQPGPGQFDQEHNFPGAAEMHGYMQPPQMQGAGPEVAMQAYGQPVDGVAFAGTNGGAELPPQMQGVQHMGFNGMPADPNGMSHMMMHFPNQRMHGQWPGYNGIVANGMGMPGEMPSDGAMFQPAANMVHQHPGYAPVVPGMNAQGPFPPPMNGTMGPGFPGGMAGPGAGDKPDHAPASSVEMVEQLMANVSTGPEGTESSDKQGGPGEAQPTPKSNGAFMQMPVAASPTTHQPNFFGMPYLPGYNPLRGPPAESSQHSHTHPPHPGAMHVSSDMQFMGYSNMGAMHGAHPPETSAPPQHAGAAVPNHASAYPRFDPTKPDGQQHMFQVQSGPPTLPQNSAKPPSGPNSTSHDAASSVAQPASQAFAQSGFPPHSHMMYPMHVAGPHPGQFPPPPHLGMPMPPAVHVSSAHAASLGPPYHSAPPGVLPQVAGVPVHVSQPGVPYPTPPNLSSNAPGAPPMSYGGSTPGQSTDQLPANLTPRVPSSAGSAAHPPAPPSGPPNGHSAPGGPPLRGPQMHAAHPPPGMHPRPSAAPLGGVMHSWGHPPPMGVNMQMPPPQGVSMQSHPHPQVPQSGPVSTAMHAAPPSAHPPPQAHGSVHQPTRPVEQPPSEPPSTSTPSSAPPPSGPPPGLSMHRGVRSQGNSASAPPPAQAPTPQAQDTKPSAPLTPPGLQIPPRSTSHSATQPNAHQSPNSGAGGTRGTSSQAPSSVASPANANASQPQVPSSVDVLSSMGIRVQSSRNSLQEPSTARSAASSMHAETPNSMLTPAAGPALNGATAAAAALIHPPGAAVSSNPVSKNVTAGTAVNISDLFASSAPPSQPPSTEPVTTAHPDRSKATNQKQNQSQQAVRTDRRDADREWNRKKSSEDEPPDEARPPPGPPTLLPINPPPPGILQLKGERTNSTVAVPEGTLPVASMAGIDQAAAALVHSLKASEQEHRDLRATFAHVQNLLQQIRPDGKVYLYGSVESKLCLTQNNDLDITLVLGTPGQPAQEPTEASDVVEQLGEALEERGMQNIKVLKSARVPVVKFTVPGPNTQVDVTINNLLPLRNTALIATYCAIDVRLRDMIFIIKHWAKTRHIADAYQSTLSSYAWVLMCIFIAQRAGLVPVLHREDPKDVDDEVEVAGKVWKCQFNTDVKKHAAAAQGHWITTGGLLTMFFDYFATRFDFNSEVVCPARGHSIPKQELDWTRKIGTEKHLCSIQDPLLLSHDLGRTVHYETRKVIQQELGRASRIMYTTHDPLRMLCEPYRSSVYAPRGGSSNKERDNAGRGGARDSDGRNRGFQRNGPDSRGGFDNRHGRRGGAKDSRRRQHQSGPPRGPPTKPSPPGFEAQEPLLDGRAVV